MARGDVTVTVEVPVEVTIRPATGEVVSWITREPHGYAVKDSDAALLRGADPEAVRQAAVATAVAAVDAARAALLVAEPRPPVVDDSEVGQANPLPPPAAG